MTRSKTPTTPSPDDFQASLFGEEDSGPALADAVDLVSLLAPTQAETRADEATATRFELKLLPDESASRPSEATAAPQSPKIRRRASPPKPRRTAPPATVTDAKIRQPTAVEEGQQEQPWLLQALELSRLRARAESGHWQEQLTQWSSERGHAVSTSKRNLQSAYDYGSIRAVLLAAGLAADIPSFEELCRRHAESGRPVGKRARLLDLGSLVGLAPAPTLHRLTKSWLKDELDLQEIQALRQSIARAPSGEVSNLKRRRGRNAGARAQAAWTDLDPGGSMVVKANESPELLGQTQRPVGVWRKVRLDAPREILGNGQPASQAEPEQIVLLFQRSGLETDIVQLMVVPEELRSLGGWVPDLGADKLWMVVGESFDASGLPSYCGLIRISRSGGLRFEVERRSTDLRPYPEKRNQLLSYCLLKQLDRQPLHA